MPINHQGRYTDKNTPVVVIDTTTHKRWPIWVEIDSQATTAGGHGGADPSGEELRLRAPLHRRDAKPEDIIQQDHPGPRGFPLLPR